MADIFPVLMFDKLTLEIPTFSANSFNDIPLSAITLFSLRIIAIKSPYKVSSDSFWRYWP